MFSTNIGSAVPGRLQDLSDQVRQGIFEKLGSFRLKDGAEAVVHVLKNLKLPFSKDKIPKTMDDSSHEFNTVLNVVNPNSKYGNSFWENIIYFFRSSPNMDGHLPFFGKSATGEPLLSLGVDGHAFFLPDQNKTVLLIGDQKLLTVSHEKVHDGQYRSSWTDWPWWEQVATYIARKVTGETCTYAKNLLRIINNKTISAQEIMNDRYGIGPFLFGYLYLNGKSLPLVRLFLTGPKENQPIIYKQFDQYMPDFTSQGIDSILSNCDPTYKDKILDNILAEVVGNRCFYLAKEKGAGLFPNLAQALFSKNMEKKPFPRINSVSPHDILLNHVTQKCKKHEGCEEIINVYVEIMLTAEAIKGNPSPSKEERVKQIAECARLVWLDRRALDNFYVKKIGVWIPPPGCRTSQNSFFRPSEACPFENCPEQLFSNIDTLERFYEGASFADNPCPSPKNYPTFPQGTAQQSPQSSYPTNTETVQPLPPMVNPAIRHLVSIPDRAVSAPNANEHCSRVYNEFKRDCDEWRRDRTPQNLQRVAGLGEAVLDNCVGDSSIQKQVQTEVPAMFAYTYKPKSHGLQICEKHYPAICPPTRVPPATAPHHPHQRPSYPHSNHTATVPSLTIDSSTPVTSGSASSRPEPFLKDWLSSKVEIFSAVIDTVLPGKEYESKPQGVYNHTRDYDLNKSLPEQLSGVVVCESFLLIMLLCIIKGGKIPKAVSTEPINCSPNADQPPECVSKMIEHEPVNKIQIKALLDLKQCEKLEKKVQKEESYAKKK